MKTRFWYRLLTVFVLLCATGLRAQSIRATVSEDTVRLGETFTLTVVVEELEGMYTSPAVPGFRLNGSSKYRDVDYTRGKTRNVFTYVLQAYRAGNFKIEPATVSKGRKTYRSNVIAVVVMPDAKRKDVFMRAVPSKKKVYVGERIDLDIKLYLRLDASVRGANNFKLPSQTPNFWKIPGDGKDVYEESEETIDGMQYAVSTIYRDYVYPNTSGYLSIGSYNQTVYVRQKIQQDNPTGFDDNFIITEVPVNLETDNVLIEAMPLPEAGKPKYFKGDVGSFNLTAEVGANEINAGDGFTMKVTISGSGLLQLIAPPELELPEGFETSAPVLEDHSGVTKTGPSGSKTFVYTIIAQKPGKYTLPGVHFDYFDPETETYVQRATPSFTIQVNPAKASAPSTSDFSTGVNGFDEPPSPYGKIVWSALGLLALGISYVFWQRRKSNVGRVVAEQNEEVANEELATTTYFETKTSDWKHEFAQAEQAFQTQDYKRMVQHCSAALRYNILERTGLAEADLSLENIRYRVRMKEGNEATAVRWSVLRDKCGMAQLSALSAEGTGELLEEVRQFLGI